jgi:hypothetical protein
MEFKGKLYGKLGNKYFDTGKTAQDFDDVVEALQDLTHLHGCEQEGLSSGQPTASEWYEAVNKANEAIEKALS